MIDSNVKPNTEIHQMVPNLALDIGKVRQIYDNYEVNYHAGLTFVAGHPFNDEQVRSRIKEEQQAILQVFKDHNLENSLVLYDVDTQVHGTLLQLAEPHDASRNDQRVLDDKELVSTAKGKLININHTVTWIKKTQPFNIEIGPDVPLKGGSEQSYRITDSGQILIKGLPSERGQLASIRAEFEEQAGIVHRYGKQDDDFYFVIGYMKPDDPNIMNPSFRAALKQCVDSRRPLLKLSLKVDAVKVIAFDRYSLSKESCRWQTTQMKLGEEHTFPEGSLLDAALKANSVFREQLEKEGLEQKTA
jgi:hypothetical protein